MAEQNQPTNDQEVAAQKLREAAQRQAQAAKDTEFAAENAPGLTNPEAADEQKGGKQHNNKEHANQYTQGQK